MKLTKQHVEALAMNYCKRVNALHNAEKERREKEQMAKWLKTPDGKLYAKLPEWMKKEIGEYDIRRQSSFKDLEDKSPMPPSVSVSEAESTIIIATIDAVDTNDIMKALNAQFNTKVK